MNGLNRSHLFDIHERDLRLPPTKIGQRCPVCDKVLKKSDNLVIREDITRVVFGEEHGVKVHERCQRGLGTRELYFFLVPIGKTRRYA